MECPITYEEKSIKRIIDPNAKFILIGNRIDGFLDFDFQEFKNFDEVKVKLFDILCNIKCAGEWNTSLYQVKDNYKIKHLYGYYMVPNRGKLIYSHTYMDETIKQITYSDNTMIVFGTYIDYWKNCLAEGQGIHNYKLYINILKIKFK
jgi:hypothetical protein